MLGGNFRENVAAAITFVLQQILVPIVSMIVCGIGAVVLGKVVGQVYWLQLFAGLVVYAIPCASGLILGYLARGLGEPFRRSGRWIWLLPSSLFALALLGSLFTGELIGFFVARDGESEEGLGLFLVTLPTAACCFYALGIRGSGAHWRNP